jgi:hypothetical protein
MKTFNEFVREKPIKHISKLKAREVGDKLNLDWNKYDFEQFYMGINVELEHGRIDPKTNVTDDDLIKTAKIAIAHLNELDDYYTRLKEMEEEGEEKD